MKYSTLTPESASRDIIDTFGGYNHNLKINDNEFYDMENLSSDHYPVLSPRKRRSTLVSTTGTISAMTARDVICFAAGLNLYIGGERKYRIKSAETILPTQLISMGTYIIIMPNKEYYNTQDESDKGKIESIYELPDGDTVSYSLCTVDGEDYNISEIASDTPPISPSDKQLWIDTSKEKHILKQYSVDSGIWVQIATTYIKISASGIGAGFKQYDGVKISGLDTAIAGLKDLEEQISPLWKVHHDSDDPSKDYIVVVGILDTVAEQTSKITVARTMPDMDFVFESGNRLWGCKYGCENGKAINEIYASKLGDFKNFNCFMGVSTDSYVASVGSLGSFTGAISYLGYPLFFKEDCLHKVYGSYPANYQIQTVNCNGVQKGAAKSLAVVDSVLYYKARASVCAYDGSLPVAVSANLGGIHYSEVNSLDTDELRNGACGGATRGKYYISMCSEIDHKWYFFAYDTRTGLWHKEDNTHVVEFCSFQDDALFVESGSKTLELQTLFGTAKVDSEKSEKVVKWMAESGTITCPYANYGSGMAADKKYISKLSVRMSLDIGTRVVFYAQYDSTGEWEYLGTVTGTKLQSFTVPIRPKRCDNLRLRIEGIGDAKIYSIARTFERGSDE